MGSTSLCLQRQSLITPSSQPTTMRRLVGSMQRPAMAAVSLLPLTCTSLVGVNFCSLKGLLVVSTPMWGPAYAMTSVLWVANPTTGSFGPAVLPIRVGPAAPEAPSAADSAMRRSHSLRSWSCTADAAELCLCWAPDCRAAQRQNPATPVLAEHSFPVCEFAVHAWQLRAPAGSV